jgi:hypothetical protein
MSRFGGLGLAMGLQGLPASLKYGASMMIPIKDEDGNITYQMPNIMSLGAVSGRSSNLLVMSSVGQCDNAHLREWKPTYHRLL